MVPDTVRVAIATNALGKSVAGHDIYSKLVAAHAHGFDGVELAFECLETHASTSQFAEKDSREGRLRLAAKDIESKASALSLEIIALNPFGAYDGLRDQGDIESRLREADLWLQLCEILGAPILQKPLTSDAHDIAKNIRRLGLLAKEYNKIVAYEATAWGIHIDTWQQTRDIVALVGLPNVRLCLDTFHIAAREAGDPFNKAAPIRVDGRRRLEESLAEMRHTVTASDIGYFQLSDATVADPDQTGYPRRDLGQPPFMTQSRNCRIFPCEPQYGGTLPVVEVARAVFDLGYRGWVSMEVFHTDLWKQDRS
ncbi:uncharacterized protein Z519_06677 [Cladophialophora bantiana CBS 173.52]|uniref:Xylose isomerase-like TIM barrel domain-containing protein n=1 Tax=Cladophialophora bantiana (strain ATCC 10958 / CBS 173.52 / CDC B-1940 / NIH 8579) TaxID=1442370 RepID=A0A0D2HHT3_CLAB1|nr:uncharacterized protein Z519_06677 [Cladophialophora bantiana CBS 173.52]KIW92828.1 hypothetical protein Z519_06677 [Cladophialophora bantiana CBS 173.52]